MLKYVWIICYLQNFALIRFFYTSTVGFIQLVPQVVTTCFEYVAHGACSCTANMLRQHARVGASIIATNPLRHSRGLELL